MYEVQTEHDFTAVPSLIPLGSPASLLGPLKRRDPDRHLAASPAGHGGFSPDSGPVASDRTTSLDDGRHHPLLRHRHPGAQGLREQADPELLELPTDLLHRLRQRTGWQQVDERGVGVLAARDDLETGAIASRLASRVSMRTRAARR